jgi:choline dehydrogenase-like flavoprotein
MSNVTEFDAIVVGSGVSGGWAAKELTEKGLNVLMIERGRMVEHGKDYVTEHKPWWDNRFRNKPLREIYDRDYPEQQRLYAFSEMTRHYFINDRENPYNGNEGNDSFLWHRADVVGGRSLLWGRQVYRWSDLDFEANKKDGHGIDWPIRYQDIAPWYSYVEKFAGITGQAEGLAHLPDGEFQKPMPMSAIEKHVKAGIEANYDDRIMTMGRCAVLTEPLNGRAPCHYCGPCERGCSTGSYFSTQSATLPAARATGRLTLMSDTVVEKLITNDAGDKISAVQVIDRHTGERKRYSGKIVFLNASTLASIQILMNSKTAQHPNGLCNQSGTLGQYLMDHTLGSGAVGIFPLFNDLTTYGRRPNGIYIPRFRNVNAQDEVPFVRGYGYQGSGMRMGGTGMAAQYPGFGAGLKQAIESQGPWMMYLGGFGECLPFAHNAMSLDANKVDSLGLPIININFSWSDNEQVMREDLVTEAEAMLKAAGAVHTMTFKSNSRPGEGIHEMGGARMGHSPQDSVLNAHNQAHEINNLFITDGACMTSSSCVNPSITYMALTARAADYAVAQLAEGRI